jgi:hypothetical protein
VREPKTEVGLFTLRDILGLDQSRLLFEICLYQPYQHHSQSWISIANMAPSAINNEPDTSPNGNNQLHGTSNPVKSSESTLPEVREFDNATTTVEDVVNALKITGGVIIRNFLGLDEIDHILEDVTPYLEADKPWTDGQYVA